MIQIVMMNNVWVEAIDTLPIHARFRIKGNTKVFFPPGARMHSYISEDLRSKGEDHIDILFYCGRPLSGGGFLGFCPQIMQVYYRRHVKIDRRFVDCVGAKFEEYLKIHRQAREWSERDTRGMLDKSYVGQVLEELIRHGLANHSAEEQAEKRLKIQHAVDELSPKEQHRVVQGYLTRKNKGSCRGGELAT
jgi:hypothetical protein